MRRHMHLYSSSGAAAAAAKEGGNLLFTTSVPRGKSTESPPSGTRKCF